MVETIHTLFVIMSWPVFPRLIDWLTDQLAD